MTDGGSHLPLTDPSTEQRRAADPAASAWVDASAGSGKTKVLTDRVLGLLLAGAQPHKILCLTFTKAAAGEMANRIAGRLSSWARLSDADLADDVASLTGAAASPDERDRARREEDRRAGAGCRTHAAPAERPHRPAAAAERERRGAAA